MARRFAAVPRAPDDFAGAFVTPTQTVSPLATRPSAAFSAPVRGGSKRPPARSQRSAPRLNAL